MLIRNPPVEISDSLMMLGTNPYPIYLLQGETGAALLEGGVGAMGSLVAQQLDGAGAARDTIRQIVIPHAHPDHVMAVPRLKDLLPGAKVLASEAAAATLANEKAVGFFSKMDGAITESLVRDGVIGEEHRPGPLAEMKIAVDQTLADGDTLTVDGRSLHVLATPGHSDCSLSFHDADAGVLLVSDAVPYYFVDHEYFWPNYFAGYRQYLESMQRLKALGAEVLCTGHQCAVRGADAVAMFFDDCLAATEQYHRRIVGQAKSGKTGRQIGEELGAEVHEKTQVLPLDFFQKNCGLMAKLSFQHEGIEEPK